MRREISEVCARVECSNRKIQLWKLRVGVLVLCYFFSWGDIYTTLPTSFKKDSDEEETPVEKQKSHGRYRGLILRSQLIVLLNHKIFNETSDKWNATEVTLKLFRDAYPRYSLNELNITGEEMDYHIDLRPFMNPSSYTVQHSASLPKVFRLFRTLGLRHLPVVSDRNKVIGMVTRKDLARYRIWKHRGKMWFEELRIAKISPSSEGN